MPICTYGGREGGRREGGKEERMSRAIFFLSCSFPVSNNFSPN